MNELKKKVLSKLKFIDLNCVTKKLQKSPNHKIQPNRFFVAIGLRVSFLKNSVSGFLPLKPMILDDFFKLKKKAVDFYKNLLAEKKCKPKKNGCLKKSAS